MCVHVCVCVYVYFQDTAIITEYQILESKADKRKRGCVGWWTLFTTCFFIQNFPVLLVSPALAIVSVLYPHSIGTGMEWHAWNVSTLHNIFGSSLSPFPWKAFVVQAFALFLYFCVLLNVDQVVRTPGSWSSVNFQIHTDFPQKKSRTRVPAGDPDLYSFCS